MNVIKPLPLDAILLHALDDIVFIMEYTDESVLRYAFFNEAALAQTPIKEEHLGKTLQDVHEAPFAEKLQQNYEQAIERKESIVLEDEYYGVSGEKRFAKARLIPFFDAAGNCTHIVEVVKDMTEARIAQRAYEDASERLKESRSRYRSLFDNNKDAIFSLDLDGKIVSINKSVTQMLGYKIDELLGVEFFEELIIDGKEKARSCFHGGHCYKAEDFRVSIKSRDHEIGVLVSVAPVEVKGANVGWYVILKDMTELDQMASQYIESESRFRIIAENSHDVVFLLDKRGMIVYVSPACKEVYGYSREDYIGSLQYEKIHPEDVEALETAYKDSVKLKRSFVSEARIYHKTEGWRLSEIRGTPVFDDFGELVHMVTIARDVSIQREREQELVFYAFHDFLTGLPNRRQLKDHLQHYIDDPMLNNQTLAIGIIDIDDFKLINDYLGHEAGDAVIEEFGKRLADVMEGDNLAARLGGDEFAMVLHDVTNAMEKDAMIRRLHAIVAEPIVIKDFEVNVNISIGLVLAVPADETVSSLLKQADMAMYDSKNKKIAGT